MHYRLYRMLLNAQGGEGGGGNTNGDGGTPKKADLSVTAAGMIAQANGDAGKVIVGLLRENHGYRTKLRDVQAKVPADGAIVLTGDDLKRHKAFMSLGDDPKAIKDALAAGQAAITERDGMVRERAYPKAASLGGYDEKLFSAFAKRDKLNIAIEPVKDKDGKDAEAAFVLGEGDAKTPLADFVAKNWSDIKDSLGGQKAVETTRKSGMPSRANDNTPPPKPGAAVTPDARTAYLKTIGRSGL